MKTASPLITDEQSLISASSRFGHPIPIYDDGYGPLFVHRDSMGISGIVRSQTWEDAYSICEDEFFPAATETHEEWIAEYGENYTEDACWNEAFGFRNNSRREDDGTLSSIYAKDLNGDSLDLLTPELLEALEITLEIETPVEPETPVHWFSWHSSRRLNASGRSVFSMMGRYRPYSRIAPNFVSRFKTCRRNSHYGPGRDNHAAEWR